MFYAAGCVTAIIRERPELTGVMEVGAKNSITLSAIAAHMKKTVQFSGSVEVQEVQSSLTGLPDAREVLSFVSTMT